MQEIEPGIRKGGSVLGLVANMQVAAKLVQAAKTCHLTVYNFDKAERFSALTAEKKPVLVILDLDQCEVESFKVLKEMRQNADLKTVAAVGFVSSTKSTVGEEARRAGCHRVYTKSEFMQGVAEIMARYAT